MIPKILHQTSRAMTWEERRLTAHARALMPDFDYKFWDDAQNLALFESLFPDKVDTYLSLPGGVARADIARCLYLYTHGGIYFDTDYKFYQRPDAAFMAARCVLGIEEEDNKATGGGIKVGNAFMASEKKFPLWPEFVASIFHRYEKGEDRIIFLGGPHALSLFLKENPVWMEGVSLWPQSVIYPGFSMMKLTTLHDADTIGAHLCWGSWRGKSVLRMVKAKSRRILSAGLASLGG